MNLEFMKIRSFALLRWNRASTLVGAMVWILLVLPLTHRFELPVQASGETWLIERLLLLSILVFTPLTLSLVTPPANDGISPWLIRGPFRAAVLLQPFAA